MALPRAIFWAVRSFKATVPLMRDTRVPALLKVLTVALGLLIISPLDIFADIPILGLFDDAALLALLCTAFVWLAGRALEKNVTPTGSEIVVTRRA